jgi:hypothetical protein
MNGHVLIDNWTLQNAGELLAGVRSNTTAQELLISADSPAVQYAPIPQDIVALACLCQLVQTVVFADHLVTDADYASSWSDLPSITLLARNGLLTTKPFKAAEADWAPRREHMADLLCETPAVRAQHERNKRDYAATQQSSDPMLSQVLWGAAGLLARAEFAHLPYVPHPLRERLLLRSPFFARVGNARAKLTNFIEQQQLRLYRSVDCEALYGEVRLPPVMVETLQATRRLEDLLPSALELRVKYRELRQWLNQLQEALDSGDLPSVLARHKELVSVSQHIDRLSGDRGGGSATLQLGAHFPNLTFDVIRPVSAIRQRFGIRGQINRLILSPSGKNALKSLLTLLAADEKASATLESTFHAFQARG